MALHAVYGVLAVLGALWAALALGCACLALSWGPRLAALYLLIQPASGALLLVGLPICAVLAYCDLAHYDRAGGRWHWPAWAWPWDNEEDGTHPHWYAVAHPTWSVARLEFTWSALRNPVNNLRFVAGFSKAGRPLWHRSWTIRGRQFYAQAGWLTDGYPVLSAGAGPGD